MSFRSRSSDSSSYRSCITLTSSDNNNNASSICSTSSFASCYTLTGEDGEDGPSTIYYTSSASNSSLDSSSTFGSCHLEEEGGGGDDNSCCSSSRSSSSSSCQEKSGEIVPETQQELLLRNADQVEPGAAMEDVKEPKEMDFLDSSSLKMPDSPELPEKTKKRDRNPKNLKLNVSFDEKKDEEDEDDEPVMTKKMLKQKRKEMDEEDLSPLERKRRRMNRLVFFFSVGCIVCHTLADIFLFQSNLGHNFRHKWLPLFLRSVIQMITSAALSLGVKSSPLGPPASIALNIVLSASTFGMLFLLDYSLSNFTHTYLFMTSITFVPLAVFIYSASLAIEPFKGHRTIVILILLVASLLLTHPTLFLFSKHPPSIAPIFTTDVIFGFPMAIPGPVSAVNANKPTDSFLAYITFLLVPVMTAYVMVLIHITSPRRKNSQYVAAFWMGLGGLSYAIYALLSAPHGPVFPPALSSLPSNPIHLIYMISTALFGTAGTILFIYILQRKTPNLSVIIRLSEVAVIFLVQMCVGMKGFYYSDLFGFALIASASVHAAIELLFYEE